MFTRSRNWWQRKLLGGEVLAAISHMVGWEKPGDPNLVAAYGGNTARLQMIVSLLRQHLLDHLRELPGSKWLLESLKPLFGEQRCNHLVR